MIIKLEKETGWLNGQATTKYYVWADDRCVEVAYSEEEAYYKYENVKANYVGSSKQILKEEEI
jgi:hypothetical protein